MNRCLPMVVSLLATMGTQAGANAGGDPLRGEQIFDACRGCHEVGPGAVNQLGPHLNGIFDRPAGAMAGFAYSADMNRAAAGGLIWTYETLDDYLENPRILISGTRMTFAGLPARNDRDDVLAYLRQFSAAPSDIPEGAPTAARSGHDLDPAILNLVGDPAYGEYLSGECTTCHQLSGQGEGIPAIVGWPVEDFVIALHAYKDGRRSHEVMQMMAGRLSNEEISSIAAYFHNPG